MVKEPPSFYIWTAAFSIILVNFHLHIQNTFFHFEEIIPWHEKGHCSAGDLHIGEHTGSVDSLGTQEDVESDKLLFGNFCWFQIPMFRHILRGWYLSPADRSILAGYNRSVRDGKYVKYAEEIEFRLFLYRTAHFTYFPTIIYYARVLWENKNTSQIPPIVRETQTMMKLWQNIDVNLTSR